MALTNDAVDDSAAAFRSDENHGEKMFEDGARTSKRCRESERLRLRFSLIRSQRC